MSAAESIGKYVAEMTDVNFSYADTAVLQQLNMQVEAGTIFGLLGANGAGKTTIIRLLTGQLIPLQGNVSVFGVNPVAQATAVRARLGLMQEDAGHYGRLSVRRNLGFFASLYAVENTSSHTDELLAKVGLLDKANSPVNSLSRGMRQRLGLARALVGNPELLILDEPTAGLDPVAAKSVRELIKSFCQNGKSVFLTTHLLEEAESLCHKVAILHQHHLVCCGNPLDLCAQYLPEEVEVQLAGRKVMRRPGLEQLFYKLTGREIS